MKSVVRFEMTVPVDVKQEGGIFVACCPSLDVFSQGATKEEATAHLIEALQLFIETCYEMGTLGQVLRSQGFEPGENGDDADEGELVHVPLSLVAQNAKACPA